MTETDIARVDLLRGASEEERDREVDRVLGRARAVVGIEADVGDREDWAEWWPRPVSCCTCELGLSRASEADSNSYRSYSGPWLWRRIILLHYPPCSEYCTIPRPQSHLLRATTTIILPFSLSCPRCPDRPPQIFGSSSKPNSPIWGRSTSSASLGMAAH